MRADRKPIGKNLAFGPVSAPGSPDAFADARAVILRGPNGIRVETIDFDSAGSAGQKSFGVHDRDAAAVCRIAAE